jgi:rod shape-determining protein MreD
MRIKIIFYTICILLIVIIQSTILDSVRIFNIIPNVMIVFVICAAFLRGSIEGAAVGFFMGLVQDMLFGTILGFYALLGMYLGLVVGVINRRLYRDNLLVIVFFTFFSTIGYEASVFFMATFGLILGGQVNVLHPLFGIILPEAFLNCIVSVFIYLFLFQWSEKFDEIDRSGRRY